MTRHINGAGILYEFIELVITLNLNFDVKSKRATVYQGMKLETKQIVTRSLFLLEKFLLGCVSIWCSCRFPIFSVLSELDWLHPQLPSHAVVSLEPDPIICAPWSVLAGKTLRLVQSKHTQLNVLFFSPVTRREPASAVVLARGAA